VPDRLVRRCSTAFLCVQALWLAATVAAWSTEPYLGVAGALGQFAIAGIAALVAAVLWWRVRPRGRALAWLALIPVSAAVALATALLLLSSFRWGC
jgi:hypothetical protein